MDHVFEDPDWLEECVPLLVGLPVLYVAVRCTLPVLERREQQRGDRHLGLAKYQFELMVEVLDESALGGVVGQSKDDSALRGTEFAEAAVSRACGPRKAREILGRCRARRISSAVSCQEQLDIDAIWSAIDKVAHHQSQEGP